MFIVILMLASTISGYKTAHALFVTKCKADDVACLKANTGLGIPLFADGMPEYGVEPLDPIFMEYVDLSKMGLKLIIYNLTITGIKGCQPVDIHRDIVKGKLHLKISCTLNSTGRYELTGKVLAIDLRGQGPSQAYLQRVEIETISQLEEIVDKNGNTHYNITSYKYRYDLKEKSFVVFENLFQGNQALSSAAADLIKKSGNDIIKEVGEPLVSSCINKCIKNIGNFLRAIPKKDLVLE